MKRIPDHIVGLNAELIKGGVRYIHWKSNIHLKEGLYGETDLDILVHSDDKKKFVSIASHYEFVKVISPIWCSYPFIEDFVGCDPETGIMKHLHVHYKMLTGFKRVKHFRIPWEVKILESRIIDTETGWPLPTNVDEFIVFLMRMQLKSTLRSYFTNSAVYPNHVVDEYRYLSNKVKADQLMERLDNFEVELTECEIRCLLLGDDYNTIKAIGKKVVSQIKHGSRYSFPVTLLVSFYKGAVYWLARRNHRKGKLSVFKKRLNKSGLTVAFIGIDGSGKSSVTSDIYRWLIPKVDAHSIYLGSGDGKKGGVEKIRTGLRKKSPVNASNNNSFRVIIRSLFDTLLIIRKAYLIRRSKKISCEGSVVIMDRFPQNQFFGINDGPKIPKLKTLFLFRAIESYCFRVIEKYKPDVVIRLSIDFDTSMSRKPDHNPDIIKEKVKIINKINFDNIVDVDAKQDLNEVILDTKSLLWSMIKSTND